MRKPIPSSDYGQTITIKLCRSDFSRLDVHISVGTRVVIDSHMFGDGREIMARDVIESFLDGDLDGSVLR